MSQLAFDVVTIPAKPCSLTTVSVYADNGRRKFRFECACGEIGEWVWSGPAAAGLWMKHDALLRVDESSRTEER